MKMPLLPPLRRGRTAVEDDEIYNRDIGGGGDYIRVGRLVGMI